MFDISAQYWDTTPYHFYNITIFHGNNYINTTGSITWKNKYLFTEQCQCVSAMYLMSLLAYKFGIIIEIEIGDIYHGKYLLDGLKLVEK